MRRRLVRSTVLVVVLAVVSIAIPISFLLRRVIHDEALNRLRNEAEAVAASFGDELTSGALITESMLAHVLPTNERIQLITADGKKLIAGPRGRLADELEVTVAGPQRSTLTLADSGTAAEDRVRRALALVGLTSALVVIIAGVLAWLEAKRLTAPLARVVSAVDEMGAEDFSKAAPHCGLVEIDALADALNRLSDRDRELVRAEREFSANAAHQLRSALTSLRLRLETLAQTRHDDVREDAQAALVQAEKLSDTVADLILLARTGRAGQAARYDLARVVRLHVARIEPAAERLGRDISVNSAGDRHEAHGSPGAVGEAVDVLLSNALEHGRGAIAVDIASENGVLSVVVADEGAGISDESLATLFERRPDVNGHGIGLALARTLIEAEGGRLDLVQPRPPIFRLHLPVVREG